MKLPKPIPKYVVWGLGIALAVGIGLGMRLQSAGLVPDLLHDGVDDSVSGTG